MAYERFSLTIRELMRLRRFGRGTPRPCPRRTPVSSLRQTSRATLLLCVLLAASSCSHERTGIADAAETEGAVNVAVSKVVRADLSQRLRIAAEFRPFQEIDVHAKVAGYVKQIFVDVGDRVKKGRTLALLEVPELEDELNQAAASARRSEQEVRQAQHQLKRAQADYT